MSKIHWLVLLLLLSSFLTLQLAQGMFQDSELITNNGLITLSNESVFFEYGAEGDDIGTTPAPPFDNAGAGGGTIEDGYAHVDDSRARTGTKSIKLYQPPPVKSEGDRRITLKRKYGNKEEFYVSFWVWYPDEIVNNYAWRNLGGMKIRYEPPDATSDTDRYRNGFSLHIDGDSRLYLKVYNLYCPVRGATSGSLGEDGSYTEVYTGYHLNSSFRNRWLHIQFYFKLSNTGGGYRLYWDNSLIKDVTGITTDPRARSRWNDESMEAQYSSDCTPYVCISLYNGIDEPEVWYWVDDIVYSDTPVNETYGVGA